MEISWRDACGLLRKGNPFRKGILYTCTLERASLPRKYFVQELNARNDMAPVVPNPKKIKAFRSEAAFDTWLRANHARESEIWLRIYKKGAGKATVTMAQALDVALCWGW